MEEPTYDKKEKFVSASGKEYTIDELWNILKKADGEREKSYNKLSDKEKEELEKLSQDPFYIRINDDLL
jgi:hypothetical protein